MLACAQFADFHTKNVRSFRSSQVISLILTGQAFIPLVSEHVLFVRSVSVWLNLSWPTTALAQLKHSLCWLIGSTNVQYSHIL